MNALYRGFGLFDPKTDVFVLLHLKSTRLRRTKSRTFKSNKLLTLFSIVELVLICRIKWKTNKLQRLAPHCY